MIVVTGGAGFIGSNLVRGLNRRGVDDVLVVDDLENGEKHRNLNALRFADLVDYRDFAERLDQFKTAKIEAIFHQGACSDTTERDGRHMLRVNYEYSKTLLAFALGRCPFLYASSAAVYGDGKRGFREEEACEEPLNVYAFSKMLFDRWVRARLASAETQVAGLRYFNVYGPHESHKGRMASVVFHFHAAARAGKPLALFAGSERFRRDFVHVDDAVALNLWLWENPEVSGILNCGTGRAESFLALAEAFRRSRPAARIQEIPFPDELVGKYQDFTEADLTALRAAGCAHEFLALEEGVASYVAVLDESGGYHRVTPPVDAHVR